jgi:thioredoxin 1
MTYIDGTDETFNEHVAQSKLPVLVDFWAPWCGPCKTIGPHVEKLADSYSGRLTVVKINIDNNRVTVGKFGIKSIPAIYTFVNGTKFEHMTGVPSNITQRLVDLAENAIKENEKK